MGVRRVQLGLSNEPITIQNIVRFDCMDLSSTLNNSELTAGLGTRVYSIKSSPDKKSSIDLGNANIQYNLYTQNKPGLLTTSINPCYFNLQGIFHLNHVWHILIISLSGTSTNVGGGGSNYMASGDLFAVSGNNRYFCRFGWNKVTQKITIQPFVSSNNITVFNPIDIYSMNAGDICLFAAKLFNRIDGSTGTAISYIKPDTGNNITTVNYSSNIMDLNVPMQSLRGSCWTHEFLSPFILHEFSFNDCNDSNIIEKVQSLRNKWNAI
jgi:hypothetical protein